MEKFRPELSDAERIELLQNSADSVKEENYYVTLTPSDLDLKRELFTDNSIKLSEIEDEFKVVKDEFKDRMKPLQQQGKELLEIIKTKQEMRSGVLYNLANYESGYMETYDHEGTLVGTRRLRPDEKKGQSKLFIPSHSKSA